MILQYHSKKFKNMLCAALILWSGVLLNLAILTVKAGLILARLNEGNKLAIKRQRNWEKII
ncbi:MAG: hypothetical protein CML51_06210 [Rhodobacteraceae bacterium]|nr:hypothetical protein [Paracoccaceae bacterium]